MSDTDNVTVTENTAVTRDPVTGEAHQVIERTVTRTDNTSWGLWVAGVAVFGAVLVIALVLLNRNPNTDDQVLAAQAEAEAARLQADQAVQDANNARMSATVTALSNDRSSASDSAGAAASAAAAEAAAARAAAAAELAANRPPAPAPESGVEVEKLPPSQ